MSIHFEVPQGDTEWFKMRLGIATASCFDQIITPKTGVISKSADGYANQLIAEIMTGENGESFSSYWMERGAILEAEARQSYEALTDLELDRGGFTTNDDMTIGASPDLRVRDRSTGKVIGGAEIKCPAPDTHVANLLRGNEIDPKYNCQVQGQILLCGFEFVDWFSYHPAFMPAMVRTHRDDAFCAKLESALNEFVLMVDSRLDKLRTMGHEIPDRPIIGMRKAWAEKTATNYMEA